MENQTGDREALAPNSELRTYVLVLQNDSFQYEAANKIAHIFVCPVNCYQSWNRV